MGIPLAHLVYVLTVTTAWNNVRNKTCNLPNGTYADLENTFSKFSRAACAASGE